MTTADDILIRDLMQTEIISVTTHTDKEEVAQLFTKYDFLAIPVLDQDERMVGIVTFDDAMDVMVDEATEDITKMAAMSPSETTYFDTSVAAHAKHRIAWLLILMFSSTITGSIITKYKCICRNPAPCILYSHVDGYRRKLRFSEFYIDHPRNCTRRDSFF